MATSPLFGWEEPDDTDLVKDGAAAIRTLGNAIDTSMGDLLGGTTGQVLSKASNTNMDFTWVDTDDTNAIQNAIVDAKGDLIAASAADTPARLAVGNNGETLVADSSTATGLKWGRPTTLGCSLWKSANQTANNVTQTPVSFNNEDFDTSGFHDNVTNNDRVTIPTGLGGKYLVTSQISFSANATGQRVLYHFINGVLVNLALSPVNSSANGSSFELSGVYNLSAGNFIQMQVYQDSGSALNILGAAQYYTNMQVIYLGA